MRNRLIKIIVLIASSCLHLAVLYILLRLKTASVDSRWSGGLSGGTETVFVDISGLAAIENPVGAEKEVPQNVMTPTKTVPTATPNLKKPSLQKQNVSQTTAVKHPEKKSNSQNLQTKPSKQQQNSVQGGGIGNSSTPAGGVGDGLDNSGPVAANAPNVLAKIRKKIVARQKYPSEARAEKVSGTVKVGFSITPDGGLAYVKVLQSSGHETLDTAAMVSVKKAAPLPYFPQPIALALEYRLEK